MRNRVVQVLITLVLLIAASAASLWFSASPAKTIGFDGNVHGRRSGEVAVLFSGDAGFLGYGLGSGIHIARTAEEFGLPVYGVSSFAQFKDRKSIPQTVDIIDGAVRAAMRKYRASRVLLIGHSFGADVVGVALPDLAPDVRRALIGVVLVVPTQPVYLRADPSTLSYHGRPDAPADRVTLVNWLPILCIYGLQERDSLCPELSARNVRVEGLPGGHALHHDVRRLDAALTSGIRPMLEGAST